MTIDSNIIIEYLSGDKEVISIISLWRRQGRPLFVSAIVEAEILSFQEFSSSELRKTEEFLEANFTSIPFDRKIARIATEIRRQVKIKFPDAGIAATAIFTHTPIVTRNIKDFKNITNLQIITI